MSYDMTTFTRPESKIFYYDNKMDNNLSTRRELSSSAYTKDPNDALKGMGSFIS